MFKWSKTIISSICPLYPFILLTMLAVWPLRVYFNLHWLTGSASSSSSHKRQLPGPVAVSWKRCLVRDGLPAATASIAALLTDEEFAGLQETSSESSLGTSFHRYGFTTGTLRRSHVTDFQEWNSHHANGFLASINTHGSISPVQMQMCYTSQGIYHGIFHSVCSNISFVLTSKI